MPDEDSRRNEPARVSPGEFVWIRRQLWRVRSVHTGAGLTRLLVEAAAANENRNFLLPAERWRPDRARPSRRVSSRRALAWLISWTARTSPAFTPSAIVGAHTLLLAYQLEPALAVLAGTRRILIADGVGLGKTVQAALIIAEMTQRRADARVLVLVPAPLVAQWSDELRTRFGIAASTANAAEFTRLRSGRPYMKNPWQGPGVWLASPDYLKQLHVLEAMPDTPFDLVVIDEAHILSGKSQRRAAIHALARSARHVVMLTATPHDGDHARFTRLVSLGATGSKADALTTFRRTRTTPARHIRRLDVNAGPGLSRVLEAIDAFERSVRAAPPAALNLICAVFRKRALSSMAALHASLDRRMSLINDKNNHEGTDDWEQLDFFSADLVPDHEWAALNGDLGLAPARERNWLARLRNAASPESANRDPKLTRLRRLLRRANEPVVVFTEYRDTLLAVATALATQRDIAVLHGGLTSAQQVQALRAFVHGHADTLLTTDVASQGINLQRRARWVINFDLPWTPARLEQRAGRVDRIGQTRLVHVTSLGVRHTAEAAQRARVAARQDASNAAALVTCTRWTRAADSLARQFARQRAVATLWRGPDPIALPRARVPQQLIQRICGTAVPRVTIVEIPLVNKTGDVLERHAGWVASNTQSDTPGHPLPTALARRALTLGARARRRLARAEAALPIGPAIGPRQPGLFDPRGVPGLPREDDGPRRSATGNAPAEAAADTDVSIGALRPLVILEAQS